MTNIADKPIRSNQEWLELLDRAPGDLDRDAAVADLYDILYAKAYFICVQECNMVTDEAEQLAANAVADQICKILEGRGRDTFRGEANFVTYVTRWVRNDIMSHLRSAGYRGTRKTLSLDMPAAYGEGKAIDPPDPTEVDTQVWHISPGLGQALSDCFAALDELDRTLLWLKRVEGWSAHELAAAYALTPNSVNLRARAAQRVQQCLAAQGFRLDDIWSEDA